jgi:hypothetical protein
MIGTRVFIVPAGHMRLVILCTFCLLLRRRDFGRRSIALGRVQFAGVGFGVVVFHIFDDGYSS